MTDTECRGLGYSIEGHVLNPLSESINSNEECKLSKKKEVTTKLCLPMHFQSWKKRTVLH